MAKSTWTSVYCGGEVSQSAIASYFGGMVDGCKILDAECLEHNDTGRTLKIRVIAREESGALREFIRTFGRQFTVTSRVPTKARLAAWGIREDRTDD